VAVRTLPRTPLLPVRLWRTYVTDVRITADSESDLYREVTPEAKATRDMVAILEALAAMFGVIVLGTLSLKTRSVWWGAAPHISIAGAMDLLALFHKGLL
jgi:hypothetical protein